jgi:hypothetical protein
VVTWQAQNADNYVFIGTIPDPLRAGDVFFLRVEARDSLGNIEFAYSGGATLTDIGLDALSFRTDENGPTFPDNTINFVNGMWEGNIRTNTGVVNNINRPGNQSQLRVNPTTAPAVAGADTTVAFRVIPAALNSFTFVVQPPASVRFSTVFNIEIIAVDQFGNFVDTSVAFPGDATIADQSGTLFEDPTPGDDQILFTSQLVGGFAVARYTGGFVVTTSFNNDVVTVTDNASSITGATTSFDVIPDVVFVELTDDRAPRVALPGQTIEMFDIRITNNDPIEDVDVSDLVFNLEHSRNGTNVVANPSTLISGVSVEDLTNTGSFPAPSIGSGTVTVPIGSPLISMGGGILELRISVTIKNDISAAQLPNLRLRLSDVVGTFQPSAFIIVPVNVDIEPITDPANFIRSSITQIREDEETAAFNYPNPFNPREQQTTLSFFNPKAGKVSIKIFTLTGRLVRDISPKTSQPAGNVEIQWDGKNGRGQVVRNGVYVAIIQPSGGSKMTVKIAVVK